MSKIRAKWLVLDPEALEASLGGALTAKLVALGGLVKTATGLQIGDESILSGMIANGAVADSKLASIFVKADGSVAFTADQSMGSNKLTNLADPTVDADASNKGYVDMMAQGYAPLPSVKVATTENITLSGAQTIDGATSLADGDLVLVKDQTITSENGIYVYNSAGAWVRAEFLDGTPEHEVRAGLTTFVELGDVGRGTGWAIVGTAGEIVVPDVDAMTWTLVGRVNDLTAENGLYITGKNIGILEDGVGSRELDLTDNYALSGAVTVPTQITTDNSNLVASTEFVHDVVDAELAAYTTAVKKQITHVVTAGEVAAGFFSLVEAVDVVSKVMIHIAGGPTQVNKATVTGAIVGDFDVLNDDEVHFNNNGAATALTEDIAEGDQLIVTYFYIPVV